MHCKDSTGSERSARSAKTLSFYAQLQADHTALRYMERTIDAVQCKQRTVYYGAVVLKHNASEHSWIQPSETTTRAFITWILLHEVLIHQLFTSTVHTLTYIVRPNYLSILQNLTWEDLQTTRNGIICYLVMASAGIKL